MEANLENIKLLTAGHFQDCPMWRFVESTESYRPVRKPEELPESVKDLRTKAEFISPNGLKFNGYIVGADRVFSIGLFIAGKLIGFNKNLPKSLLVKQVGQLLSALPHGAAAGAKDIFPLEYVTQFDWEDLGYRNFRGQFEIEVG